MASILERYWYFIAEKPAPAPHLAPPEGCAALRIVLVAVPHVSRSCKHFPEALRLHPSSSWVEGEHLFAVLGLHLALGKEITHDFDLDPRLELFELLVLALL